LEIIYCLVLGPKKSFIAKAGYIEREALEALYPANKFNPVATYAFFDALSGGNGDLVSPEDVTTTITKWKADPSLESFKSDLTLALAKKSAALLVFVGLIALVVDLIVESGLNAFVQ